MADPMGLERFHYQLTGPAEGPKLVFLHGVMGFAANFRRIARAFENRYQVLVYDQRGHGRSFQPKSGYEAEDFAGDLASILDALGWNEINLVGHSMGGRVAFQFASDHPERVTRLVIEDIGPSMHDSRSSIVTRILDQVPVPFASKAAAKTWLDTTFLELFRDEPGAVGLAAYLYANLTENAENQAVWRFYEPGIRAIVASGRKREHWDAIRRLRMPTLLIRGQFSEDLPRSLYERVLSENPVIRGVEIKNAHHWVHSEQPELFARVLERFLAGESQTSEPGIEATP